MGEASEGPTMSYERREDEFYPTPDYGPGDAHIRDLVRKEMARHLHEEHGLGVRAIARKLGIQMQRVKRMLGEQGLG